MPSRQTRADAFFAPTESQNDAPPQRALPPAASEPARRAAQAQSKQLSLPIRPKTGDPTHALYPRPSQDKLTHFSAWARGFAKAISRSIAKRKSPSRELFEAAAAAEALLGREPAPSLRQAFAETWKIVSGRAAEALRGPKSRQVVRQTRKILETAGLLFERPLNVSASRQQTTCLSYNPVLGVNDSSIYLNDEINGLIYREFYRPLGISEEMAMQAILLHEAGHALDYQRHHNDLAGKDTGRSLSGSAARRALGLPEDPARNPIQIKAPSDPCYQILMTAPREAYADCFACLCLAKTYPQSAPALVDAALAMREEGPASKASFDHDTRHGLLLLKDMLQEPSFDPQKLDGHEIDRICLACAAYNSRELFKSFLATDAGAHYAKIAAGAGVAESNGHYRMVEGFSPDNLPQSEDDLFEFVPEEPKHKNIPEYLFDKGELLALRQEAVDDGTRSLGIIRDLRAQAAARLSDALMARYAASESQSQPVQGELNFKP